MTHSASEKQFSFLLCLISSLPLLKASKYSKEIIKKVFICNSLALFQILPSVYDDNKQIDGPATGQKDIVKVAKASC